jgi:hypothetical protein
VRQCRPHSGRPRGSRWLPRSTCPACAAHMAVSRGRGSGNGNDSGNDSVRMRGK